MTMTKNLCRGLVLAFFLTALLPMTGLAEEAGIILLAGCRLTGTQK